MAHEDGISGRQNAWQLEAAEVVEDLRSDGAVGLSSDEAVRRLSAHGPNRLSGARPVPGWRRFLQQFTDTLVLLLIAAASISVIVWMIEGEGLPYEAMAIFAIVVLNAIMGYVQQARAEDALRALRERSAPQATVIRDGERTRLAAAELVPGDVILVEEGDTLPADARILQSTSLRAAEASLTGESMPVFKTTDRLPAGTAIGDRINMLFAGTSVVGGHGRAIVTGTGMGTETGRIAAMLEQTVDESTPLQRELDRTGRLLGLVVIVIAVAIMATVLLVSEVSTLSQLFGVLIIGVALAVAAVPEGLPAIVTAVLSVGVQRMAARRAIVRKLAAVETLGSTNVIASDKTGTLTRNEMTVRRILTASGRADLEANGYGGHGEISLQSDNATAFKLELERALMVARCANNASLRPHEGQWLAQGDPTEIALLAAALMASEADKATTPRRLWEIPFSSERKIMTTVHREGDEYHAFTKGAPDILLSHCKYELVGGDMLELTPERRADIAARNTEMAADALRTLAAAMRRLEDGRHDSQLENAEQDLVFIGLFGMIDPPREEAKSAVAQAMKAGIRVVMITGDHPATAAVIARNLGIDGTRVAVGADIAGMNEAELDVATREVSVYARVDPAHKLAIVGALQRQGATVAMTGDGVNDAPALKAADIGIAMGITGTDVAKGAADIVLADDNFATIVAAVEEGRSIFANIRKFLRYLLSSNIGEVMTMFFGVVFASALGLSPDGASGIALPLLATQILWINLVTDGAPALALGIDPASPGTMRRAPRPQSERVITVAMWRGIFFVGAVMAAGTLLVIDASLPGGMVEGTGSLDHARTMGFTTLTLFQLFNVFNARSDERSAFPDLFSNVWLWAAVVFSLGLHVAVVYVPVLQEAFSTVPVAGSDWLICIATASSVLWLRELWKLAGRALRARPNLQQGAPTGR